MAAEKRADAARGKTQVERVSDRELVITRTFRAPARILFDAWTRPEHVRRWWAPASMGVNMASCEADLRPGGSYRYLLQPPGPETIAFAGEYVELTPHTRLVYTSRFEPFPDPAMVTVTFEERDGATTVVSREVYPSKEALDGAVASGMEAGVHVTYDQLDELVLSLGR